MISKGKFFKTRNALGSLVCALVFLAALASAFAVKTNDVELGHQSVYDNQVHIQRNVNGQMTFQDSDLTSPVLLSDLNEGVSDHGELSGLPDDDHTQYQNDARHLEAHSSDFNSSMTHVVDVGGNADLSGHVTDGDIHLARDATVDISGDWRFSGTPAVWGGLDFSALGGVGDVLLNFEAGADDARVLWDESEDQFDLNRALRVDSALSVTGDATVDGVVYGDVADIQENAEQMHLSMDDNAANSIVADLTGHFNQTLSDPVSPNTEDHATTGILGTALEFRGTDECIAISDQDAIFGDNTEFCVAVWVKLEPFGAGGAPYIVATNSPTSTDSQYWQLNVSGNTGIIYWKARNTAMGSEFRYGPVIADGAWRHLILQRTATAIEGWLDGALWGSITDSGFQESLQDSYQEILIGCGEVLWNGKERSLDDFRVYDRALSAGEIAAIYNGGLGTTSPARFVTEVDGALSIDRLTIDGGFTTSVATLQVGEGAYCDGNSWVNVSARARKTDIVAATPETEWGKLDAIEVVEFAYKKRNSKRGQ